MNRNYVVYIYKISNSHGILYILAADKCYIVYKLLEICKEKKDIKNKTLIKSMTFYHL